jgi:hypothetical protein
MLCKYYLQLGSFTLDTESADCMDVSQMIRNLDSIKVSYSRVDLGGVVRKCGSSLEFTGKARDAILSHFDEYYLQSKGCFAVYCADDNWVYTKAWECPLDFATLQYDANVATLGCVDNSAAAIIKANKKSKYEFDVSSLKDSSNLLYNGVVTQRQMTFNVVGATPAGEVTTDMVSSSNIRLASKGYYSLYIPSIGVNTDDFTSDKITCFDQSEVSEWGTGALAKDDAAFMKSLMDRDRAGFIGCLSDCTVRIDMDVSFRFVYPQWWGLRGVKVFFILMIGSNVVWRKEVTDYNNAGVSIHWDYNMAAGEKMAFGMSVLSNVKNWKGTTMPDGSENPNSDLIFNPGLRWGSNTNTAFVNESHYNTDPITINAIRPLSLLQKLIDKMFATREDICVIGRIEDGDSLLPKTLLVAAESIRRISTNKIYSSFSDFCDFMESVFGYVYTLEEVGYYMDRELRALDRGEIVRISHIKQSYLTSQSMSNITQEGYNHMLPVGAIISEEIEDLDEETVFQYEWESGHGVNFMEEVMYYEPGNVFVIQDYNTGTYYTNWTRIDAVTQSSWYNVNGHAKEMIGLNFATFITGQNSYMFGIIRNGSIVLCDQKHTSRWLDSGENNEHVVNLTFQHRRDVFKSEVIKKLLNVNNLSYQFDESKVYSDVEVGYRKQDYDNGNNALNEFNFTNYYKTDCDLNEQTLRLVCPYRADCYGIEELLIKSSNDESTDSDNDVFIIIASASEPVDGRWQIDRSIEVQNAYTNTVFNAAIAPNKIVKNNEEYLGACAKRLKFTSSDANSAAIIGGVNMSSSFNITKQLFKVGKISIDTDDHHFPESWDGIIEFEYADKTYQGYLDSIEINLASLGTIKYNIIEKCIE